MKYRYKPKRILITIPKKQLIIVLIFLVVFSIVGWVVYENTKPIYQVTFKANKTIILTSEVNLKETKKVPTYPSDEAINSLILGPEVENVLIVFKSSAYNSLITVEGANLGYNLVFSYYATGRKAGRCENITEIITPEREREKIMICSMEVKDYENIGIDRKNPVIALVPPAFTNETSVEVKDSVVFIRGKNEKEFKLAVWKFLLAALKIKV
jgi:uncharacterized protein YpmB